MPPATNARHCPRCAKPLAPDADPRRVWCSTRCRNASAERKSRTDRDAALGLLRRIVAALRVGDLSAADDARRAAEAFLAN